MDIKASELLFIHNISSSQQQLLQVHICSNLDSWVENRAQTMQHMIQTATDTFFAQELIQYIFNCRKFQKGFFYCTNISSSQRWKLATLLPLLPNYHYTGTLSLSPSSMTAPFPTRNFTTFVRPRLAALCRGVNWWKTKHNCHCKYYKIRVRYIWESDSVTAHSWAA